MVEPTVDPLAWLGKHLEEADTDLLREMLRTLIQTLMSPRPTRPAAPCTANARRTER